VERVIKRIVLPHHPLLGRNVNHDSASRAFRVEPRRAASIRTVRHEAHIGILDQGNVGSCTGNAGDSCIYHEPYMIGQLKPWLYPPTEAGAVALYTAATAVDPYPGTYPEQDTGSDGLTIAKVLKGKGVISGYLWAFTLGEALAQLGDTPVITGIPWYHSMFETTSTGHAGHIVVRQDSGLAGGHEICVDEVFLDGLQSLAVADLDANLDRVWVGGPNSWGTSWGDGGRWYMTAREWGALLGQAGDVTAFVKNTDPAPTPPPTPVDEKAAGDRLWAAVPHGWTTAGHVGDNAKAAVAVRRWAKDTGRS
jgi:hypothetical protein